MGNEQYHTDPLDRREVENAHLGGACIREPLRATHWPEWSPWLNGPLAAISSIAAVALILTYGGIKGPIDATAQMEQLAAKLERAKAIDPETAHEIARLIRQPRYDCNQVACSAQLQARNSAARLRLEASLTRNASGGETQVAGKRGLAPIHTISTGSITAADRR